VSAEFTLGPETVTADVRIELSEPVGTLCVEHMLVGSAFQDYYEFYMASGAKTIRLAFSEPAHRAELL